MQEVYKINDKQAISETLDGETIIINLQTGSYYSMNQSATDIWSKIQKCEPIDKSTESVKTFIEKLISENLITKSDESIGSEEVEKISFDTPPTIEKYEDMQEMLLADPIHDVDAIGWPTLKKEDK